MVRVNRAIGLPHSSNFDHKCSYCVAEKHARAAFPTSTKLRASKPLKLFYANICGPITTSTINGGKCFFITIDDFPRLMRVTILKNKLEAFRAFKKFKTLAKSESKEAKIKFLRT